MHLNTFLFKYLSLTNKSKPSYKVKSTQNLKSGQIICEYIGRILLESEQNPLKISNILPHLVVYKLELSNSILENSSAAASSSSASSSDSIANGTINVIIDSSTIGNQSRHIRKSCNPNTELHHSIDALGNVRFELVALNDIGKSEELTLKVNESLFDLSLHELNENLVCNCSKSDCKISKIGNNISEPNKNKSVNNNM